MGQITVEVSVVALFLILILTFTILIFVAINASSKVRVVAQSRQEWIYEVRNTITQFIHTALIADTEFKQNAQSDTFIHYLSQLDEKKYYLELLLNPNETDSVKIHQLIEQIIIHLSQQDSVVPQQTRLTDTTLNEKIDALLQITQKLLKNEWLRIRKGK